MCPLHAHEVTGISVELLHPSVHAWPGLGFLTKVFWLGMQAKADKARQEAAAAAERGNEDEAYEREEKLRAKKREEEQVSAHATVP